MNPSIGELPENSEKVWYIINEEAHQGPFSFTELEQRRLAASTRIWAKGWPVPLAYEVLVMAYYPSPSDSPPPLPKKNAAKIVVLDTEPITPQVKKTSFKLPLMAMLVGGVALGVYWQTRSPKLQRQQGLPLPAYREIRGSFKRAKVIGPIRKLGISPDFRRVWIADTSRQICSYDLTLSSPALDNLSGEAVALQAEAQSHQHWVLFEKWTFQAGQKLWPGRYNAVLNRIDCLSSLPWNKAEKDSVVTFAVDVYVGQKRDLESNLAALRRLKRKQAEKARQALVMSWRDVEEKCRTLSAITVQIQQGFRGLLDQKIPWRTRLKTIIDRYTIRFGGFLTNFTIRNEEDFNRIGRQEVLDKVKLMERGPIINNYAKRIGFLSMEVIEWLQKGMPKRPELEKRLKVLNDSLEKVRLELETEATSAQAVYTSRAKPE